MSKVTTTMTTTHRLRALIATIATVATATIVAATATATALGTAPGGAASLASSSAAPIHVADLRAALSRGARLGAEVSSSAAARLAYESTVYGGIPLSQPAVDFTPHIAKLFRVPLNNGNISLVCTGLIITERHVATIASCPYTPGEMVLLAGGRGVAITDGLAFNVTRRVASPAYNASARASNVAVWTFQAPDDVTASVLAFGGILRGRIARAAAEPRPGARGLVGGWGITDPREIGLELGRPRNITVTIQSVTNAGLCAETFRLVGAEAPDDVFCAAGLSSGPCVGDDGAPLALAETDPDGSTYFVGLYFTSFTSADFICDPRAPSVYTRLSAHIAFLSRSVAPRELLFYD
ncbi:hypothetical protein MMPV_008912 [Pyropia vietnamensis]